jgi:hypothetical protein
MANSSVKIITERVQLLMQERVLVARRTYIELEDNLEMSHRALLLVSMHSPIGHLCLAPESHCPWFLVLRQTYSVLPGTSSLWLQSLASASRLES